MELADKTGTTFTFALRAGDILVRNGAAAANVTDLMLAIVRSAGFVRASASVTMDQIVLTYTASTVRIRSTVSSMSGRLSAATLRTNLTLSKHATSPSPG